MRYLDFWLNATARYAIPMGMADIAVLSAHLAVTLDYDLHLIVSYPV